MESNVRDGVTVDADAAAALVATTSRQISRTKSQESKLSGVTANFCNFTSFASPATFTKMLIATCKATWTPPEHQTAPSIASNESDTFLGDTPRSTPSRASRRRLSSLCRPKTTAAAFSLLFDSNLERNAMKEVAGSSKLAGSLIPIQRVLASVNTASPRNSRRCTRCESVINLARDA